MCSRNNLRILISVAIIVLGFGSGFLIAKNQPQVRGILVNHHLFAEKFIADEFEKVSHLNPSVVVLIAPNHFDAGFSRILTTDRTWNIAEGELKSASYLLPDVDVYDDPFNREHGIYNIVPFVKKTFPSSRIIPLILKENASAEEIDALAHNLHETMPSDTLFVGSFDFSHELPSDVAEFHDVMSFAAITNRDFETIPHLDIDSRAGLRLLLKTMELYGARGFELGVMANAARIANQPESADNTSYITGRFMTHLESEPQKTVTVLVIPTDDSQRFQKMPRLLYGQHITVVSGQKVTDADRALIRKVSDEVVPGIWETHTSSSIQLKTYRAGHEPQIQNIELKNKESIFEWSNASR